MNYQLIQDCFAKYLIQQDVLTTDSQILIKLVVA